MKEIGSLLDDTIEKGFSLSKKSKIDQLEEEIAKGFSHDVMNPIMVSQYSEFYNPYKWTDDGFLPLAPNELEAKSSDPTAYLQNQIFYEKFINYRKSLKQLENTLDESLEKAGAVPIGTVHKFKDGQMYRKDDHGWTPHSDGPVLSDALHSDDPEHQAVANDALEDHAGKTIAHEGEAKRRDNRRKEMEKLKKDILNKLSKQLDKMLSSKDVE